jgi:hypothetical protein
MKWVGNVACMEEKGNVCKMFVGKYEGKKPPVRLRHRW